VQLNDNKPWAELALPVSLVLLLAVFLSQTRHLVDEVRDPPSDSGIVTNSIGMELVPIPAGTFVMGASGTVARPAETPAHSVAIKPFYLSATEVTQAQWVAVMGDNPSRYRNPRHPVEQVTWLQVAEFIKRINVMEGSERYRLPSEAEWEYAARAGSNSARWYDKLDVAPKEVAWFGHDGDVGTRPVGQRLPNPFGLYDVYGNVWEWVADCWHPDYRDAPANGQVWQGGDCSVRVLRGGGWNSDESYIGSTVRGSYAVDLDDVSNGFRLAMDP
jgi:formylglycine-generating enzyme required for sulfatase activity